VIGALLLIAQSAVSPPAPDARAAVARALPALERSAKSFVGQRSCVSCHHNILRGARLRESEDTKTKSKQQ